MQSQDAFLRRQAARFETIGLRVASRNRGANSRSVVGGRNTSLTRSGLPFTSSMRCVHGFGFCGIEASAAPTCPFYQRSTVPVFSGIAGVSFQLTPSTSLAIESGLRYQSNLREDPTDLGFGPFVKDAYAGSRWSIPITTTLRVRF